MNLPSLGPRVSEALPDLSAPLPTLSSLLLISIMNEQLLYFPLITGGERYMKKKESVEVPDLDDMTSGSTNELVYDMDQLGL